MNLAYMSKEEMENGLKVSRKSRIAGHEQANVCMQQYYGDVYLRSYDTLVCLYDCVNDTLYCSGLYSMTTRKHIGWFLSEINKDYGVNYSYKDVKKLFN